jgi:hypothetical protein
MFLPKRSNDQPSRFTHIVPTISTGQYIALATLTILFWILLHPYYGIWHDATIYTAQALNILYPETYQDDVFFKYGSQASFTVFPRLHALLIEQIGVDPSAFTLTIIGQVLFFTGIFLLTRQLLTSGQTILFLIIFTTIPIYLNPVLTIFELFATSRTISAGLSLLFLSYILKNRIYTASLALIIALLLHPLVPLGVMAIVLFLQRPKVICSLLIFGAILLFICYIFAIPPFTLLDQTIDHEWRNLITQRAPFLFIERWPDKDLGLLLLEICIILSARAYCTDKLRQTFNAVLLSTLACVLLSLFASWLSNTLLIQLQLWRILLFVHIFSAIAFAWLISSAWNKNNGKVTIILYFSTFLSLNAIGGLPALAIHIFWSYSLKHHLSLSPLIVKGTYAILIQGIFWYVLNTEIIDPLIITNNPTLESVSNFRYFLSTSSFYITGFLLALLLITNRFQKVVSIILSITILLLAPIAIYYFDQRYRNIISDNGNSEPYVTLRETIPQSATVYYEQNIDACWFLLRRQHYMSPKQSAGVVFNRETAFETKRRSDLLFDAGFEDGVYARHWHSEPSSNPPIPTLEAFEELCRDPSLDYIILNSPSSVKPPDKIINAIGNQINIYYCYTKASKQ